jgi:hypothetical protein
LYGWKEFGMEYCDVNFDEYSEWKCGDKCADYGCEGDGYACCGRCKQYECNFECGFDIDRIE